MNDPEFIQRRTNLSLPSPQISDAELHQIAKLGGVVAAPPVGGSGATRTLLASYGGATPLPNTAGLRTPRTPMGRDVLLEEAQNLIALTNADTPLKGGENAELNPTDFAGMTPRSRATPTPSRGGDATPSRTPAGRTPAGKTPLGSATPSFRDGLNINEGLSAEEALELGTKRAQMRSKDAFKRKLAQGLNSLPKATNEYMLIKPELPPEVEEALVVDGDEDAEDALEKIAQTAKALEDSILRKRHTVIQRHLPRPAVLNVDMGEEPVIRKGKHSSRVSDEEVSGVRELLRAEMLQMLKYDGYTYPIDGDEENKKKKQRNGVMPKLTLLEESDLVAARELIGDEMSVLGRPFARQAREPNSDSDSDSEEEESPFVPTNVLSKAWEKANADVAFLPFEKQYGSQANITDAQKVQVLRQEFALMREQLSTETKRATKLEEKLKLYTGGYSARAAKLASSYEESHKLLGLCVQEKGCFTMLMGLETLAIPQRTAILERENAIVSKREAELQSKYAALKKEKTMLQARLGKEAK